MTLSKEALQRLADLTAAAGSWLIFDNTYEQFLFSGKEHFTINGPHIIHVFSFSKVPLLTPTNRAIQCQGCRCHNAKHMASEVLLCLLVFHMLWLPAELRADGVESGLHSLSR